MKKISALKLTQKLGLHEDQIYFALTLLTGILAGLTASFIHKSVLFLTELLKTNRSFTWESFLYGGVCIGISGYLTTRYFPSTSGSGIPNVRIALAVYHGRLSLRSTIAKLVTSILSLSSGITLGREGPTVAVTSGIGSVFGRTFHLSKKKVKALVAVGSAGGIAAAFNTPIAAVVFTLEEIVGDLNAKMLGSIVISSVIAAVTASMIHGYHPMFVQVSYFFSDHTELYLFVLVGILAAVVGPAWVSFTLKIRKTMRRVFKGHRLTIILFSFALVGLVSTLKPEILGSGTQIINTQLLSSLAHWDNLLILLALKFVLTAICYGSGVSGGLFMPTLLMGALLGSGVGLVSQTILPEFTPNTAAFALVGMGAFFATVIRAPFTSIIIIFELTRNYQIIIPLMLANTIAFALSSRIRKESIYESISEQDGIHLPTRDDNEVMEGLIVEEAMVTKIMSFKNDLSIQKAFEQTKETTISGFPILKNGKLYGVVSTQDLARAVALEKGNDSIESIATKNIIRIYPDQNLTVAFHRLKKFGISRLMVVSRLDDSVLLGIISSKDIVNHFSGSESST